MEARRFLFRALLFALPLIAVLAVEVLVLPEDAFCYRCWEALRSNTMKRWLPGPFYPERRIERTESGDLGHHSTYAVDREVVWQTDALGYRAGDAIAAESDVVIVGDSCTVGSGLTQDDTLAAALENELGLAVYPYAPCKNVGYLLHDERFQPRVVVLQKIERRLPSLREPADRAATSFSLNSITDEIVVTIDRFFKFALLHSTRRELRSAVAERIHTALTNQPRPSVPSMGVVGIDDRTLFMQGPVANQEPPDGLLEQSADRVEACCQAVREKGARFVFMPVPNKENILLERLKKGQQPTFLKDLIALLRERGVPCVDIETPYRAAAARGTEIFQHDDSHWNAEGVRIAAAELARVIERELEKSPTIPR